MKSFILIITFLISPLALSYCPLKFEETKLCAEIEWIDGPFLNKKSHFQLKFWDKDDSLYQVITPNYDVNIYSWMIMHNGHNHGGPKMTSRKIKMGVYEVRDARFFMAGMHGYWEIRVDLYKNNELISRAASKVDFD